MTESLELPPSINVGPTMVGVSVLTANGVTVQIALPRPGGLYAVSADEIMSKARGLAIDALQSAAHALAH